VAAAGAAVGIAFMFLIGLVIFVTALVLFALALASERARSTPSGQAPRPDHEPLGRRADPGLPAAGGRPAAAPVARPDGRDARVEGGEVSLVEAFAAWSIVRLVG